MSATFRWISRIVLGVLSFFYRYRSLEKKAEHGNDKSKKYAIRAYKHAGVRIAASIE